MYQQVIAQALTEQVPRIAQQIADKLIEAQLPSYMVYSSEQLYKLATAAVQAYLTDFTENQEKAFAAYWQRVAEARAEQGSQVEDLLQAVFFAEELLQNFIAERFPDDKALQAWYVIRMHNIIYSGAISLAQIFVAVRERIIRAQAEQIRELSTPIIPLHQGILAVPLVGAIDSYRVGQILETLLDGISRQQAEVVIVDITGVPIVDKNVAHYLLQTSRAAQLLGAQVVIVGISPEIAQTITQLGSDLSMLKTQSNMQSGIEYALGQLGLRISRK